MIGFLPVLHDDELFSSLLMRLFEEGAYIYPKHFLNEILDGKQRFNYLYANRYKQELVDLVDKIYGWERVIQNHTLEGWDNLFGKYSGVSPTKGFIRYCPLCKKEKKYIQVLPQIKNLNYCPIHGCRFQESRISLNRNKYYLIKSLCDFLNQEDEQLKQVILEDINVRISKYTLDVLKVSQNVYKQVKIHDYIRMYIPKGYYRSKTTAQLNINKLKAALDSFYKDLEGYMLSRRQLESIVRGESCCSFHIILVAFWLGIKPEELINRKNKKTISLSKKIVSLHEKGFSERKIADMLGISKTNVHKHLLISTGLTT